MKSFNDFIVAREELRVTGVTRDPILKNYRFCNIRREDDRVTRFLRETWPDRGNVDHWFAMVVARYVNFPPELKRLLYPVPYCPEDFLAVTEWGNAYIIWPGRVKGVSKAEHIHQNILTPLWAARPRFTQRTLREYSQVLLRFNGMGTFMVGQVIADVKQTREAEDWHTFCLPGPGSTAGLFHVLGRTAPRDFSKHVNRLREDAPYPLCAQDVQNCLCEYSKYVRASRGYTLGLRRYP